MEPNFVKVKVSELKNYFQVRGICAANKRREELLDWSVKALELAIEIIDEQGDQLINWLILRSWLRMIKLFLIPTETVVGMQILRVLQDSILLGQDLRRNEPNIFWCASQHLNCADDRLQSIACVVLILRVVQQSTHFHCSEGMEKT